MLKVNNRNTRTRCEICSKLTTKTLEGRQWRRSGVFIVNFEHVIAGWEISVFSPNTGKHGPEKLHVWKTRAV